MIDSCNIELKNIKHHADMSEETFCYSASVWLNGTRVGTVTNRGHGGPDEFDMPVEVFRRMNDWCLANLPSEESNWPDPKDPDKNFVYQPDFEAFCHAQVEAHNVRKEVQGIMRTKVAFIDPKDKGIFAIGFRRCRRIEQKHIDYVLENNPDVQILNSMPLDAAAKLYLEHME